MRISELQKRERDQAIAEAGILVTTDMIYLLRLKVLVAVECDAEADVEVLAKLGRRRNAARAYAVLHLADRAPEGILVEIGDGL